jgi:NADH-ubiquinone oxidoreductase chain 2
MLLLGIITLVMTIPLASLYLSTILIHRIAFLIILYSSLLSYNTLYVIPLSSGIGILGGLFQISIISQSLEIFILIIGSIILLLVPEGKEINTKLLSLEKENNNLENIKDHNKTATLWNYWDNLSSNVKEVLSTSNKTNNSIGLKDYPLIILFTTFGMSSLISSSDLITMFLAIELQSFALYILATMNRNSESAVAAGLKYFLLGGLSSCFILLGSTLIYSYTGLTNFESLNILQSVIGQSFEGNSYLAIGCIILTIGLLFKIGAAPLHSWAPDVYDGVPTMVTTWLTIMPKLSILVFFIMNNFLIEPNLLMISALLSLLLGSITGLAQYKIKRLLAYSTISHVGLMISALGSNHIVGLESMIFYIIQYSITSLNTFFILILLGNMLSKDKIISEYSPIQFIHQLRGLFYYNPILSIAFAISLFSMAGIPPLVGFFGKYFIINSALMSGNYFLSLVIVITSVISAVYYLLIIKSLFLPENNIDNSSTSLNNISFPENNNLSPILAYIVAILTLFIIFFIIYPTPILNSIHLTTLYNYIL